MNSIWKGIIPEEEQLFEFNLKYLFLVGLWPNENWTKSQKYIYKSYELTLHVLSIIFLVITGIGTYQQRHETLVLLSSLDKSLVGYNFVLKVVFFVLKRDRIKLLIHKISRSGDTIPEHRKKLMVTHSLSITLFVTLIVAGFSAAAQYKFEMTAEAWMPFDPMKNRKNLLLASQILAVLFVVPCLYRACAMQGLVCNLMMYVCDQLLELQSMLKNLRYSPENEADFRKRFKEIVKRHVRIMGYCKSMDQDFKEYFFIQNQAIIVELCLNALTVNKLGLAEKKILISFIVYLAVALLNAYIYCYLGNELILQSQGTAVAAYGTYWTSWPVDLQKDLLVVIRIAQRPLQLRAGGLTPMSLHTFGQVLYNGYSVFAVLNDIVD